MSIFSKMTSMISSSILLRRTIIALWHLSGLAISYFLAFALRFEGEIPSPEFNVMLQTFPALALISLILFSLFRLYSGLWVFVSLDDLVRILLALVVTTAIFMVTVFMMMNMSFHGFPRSVFALQFLLMAGWMAGGRLAMRWLRERRLLSRESKPSEKRSIVVGNMEDVDHLLHALGHEHGGIGRLEGIVSDEKGAHHLTIRGIRVFGSVDKVGAVAKDTGAQCVLILPPYTRPKAMSEIVENCEKAGATCAFRMVPSTVDLAAGRIELSSIRKVELEDLLGRPEISFDHDSVRQMIAGKAVMITGAGGSIGSELTRQVAHYAPAKLILMDTSEFNLYTIEQELRSSMPELRFVCVAGDCGDPVHARSVLIRHKVQVIYHAAAYKHVPMMEENVSACILNNTLGTARLAEQAELCRVERFVLISSDKAVRPTSVMGASKRLAERLIQERSVSESAKTCFVMVRFGNVLGSSGSVVPLFRRQIMEGGPVTVTTPKMTRFFMSIPEAVDLVLQAGVVGHDRDIMVLEMGNPIKIVDLARRMIELSGLKVGEDIDIVFTGMRHGEKEYEELMTDGEDVVKTSFDKIWVMRRTDSASGPAIDMELLGRLVEKRDDSALRGELLRLLPEASSAIIS